MHKKNDTARHQNVAVPSTRSNPLLVNERWQIVRRGSRSYLVTKKSLLRHRQRELSEHVYHGRGIGNLNSGNGRFIPAQENSDTNSGNSRMCCKCTPNTNPVACTHGGDLSGFVLGDVRLQDKHQYTQHAKCARSDFVVCGSQRNCR